MSARDRIKLAVGLVLIAVMGLFSGLHFEMETDITVFLPDQEEGDAQTLAELSRAMTHGELTRTMVLLVRAESLEKTLEAGRELEVRLRDDARTASRLAIIEGGPPPDYERAVYELFFPRRFDYLARDREELEETLSEESLEAAANALLERLANPTSTMLTQIAPRDPFLIFPSIFDGLARSGRGDLSVLDGRYFSERAKSGVLFIRTHAGAFDTRENAPLIEALEDILDELRESVPALHVDQSGVHRFALRAEEMIKADITRISLFSVVLLSSLLLLLFRSLRFIALASLPIGAGMLAGLTASLLVYGRVHGISLAFGAAMLGVTIDYVVHLYAHQALAPRGESPRKSLEAIDRTLILCAASTTVGFFVLLFAPLPGLREVALFAMLGVITSLLVTRTFLPLLMPWEIAHTPLRTALMRLLASTLGALRRNRLFSGSLFIFAIAFAALSLPKLEEGSTIADASVFDEALMREDERVREAVTRFDQRRFVVAIGDSEDEATLAYQRAGAIAREAIQAGELESYLALDSLLVDAQEAHAMRARLQRDDTLPKRLDRAFTEAGFTPGAFAPFFRDLDQQLPPPIRYDDLLDSPLKTLARTTRIELSDGRIAYLLFLHGIRDTEALRARISKEDRLLFVDQSDLMGASDDASAGSIRKLALIALFGVFLLIALRQRSLRAALASLLPSLVAAFFTLGVLIQLGRAIDLVLVTTLLLIVCMGVDYGVFLVDAERSADPLKQRSSLLAIALSAMTTVMGFGLLALASHPLLSSIGLTALMGILTCLILAPSAIALLGISKKVGEQRSEG